MNLVTTNSNSHQIAVIAALRNNSWHSALETPGPLTNIQDHRTFHKIRDELSVSDDQDLLFRSHRLVLPRGLRQRALNIAHKGHQGLTKTRQLLREKIWFPGIDSLTKTLRAAYLENKNWKQELFLFLRNYRATPHSTTRVSPAELLFGR